ncbi:acyl-CoA synthetase family member 2, mitochondrial isoform X2 [Eurytemora carolleeae]|nr:acyl-CoA synthetase family member 2, mitochondrial isoform X2 [Eurytemora carolleeae]|eukprot:XP_023321830.1 acyl-CoA synthetase family member 2, mitochondrial-like isoform X2 [Eurytemora affinis]
MLSEVNVFNHHQRMKMSVRRSLCSAQLLRHQHLNIRSLSTCAVNRKQAPVEFHTSWSYACGPGSPPLLGLTIGQAVDRSESMYGDREAVVDIAQAKRRTFSEVKKDIDSLAAGFIELGLEPGDRLGIWGQNTLEWYTTQFAAAKAGLVLVNINPAYQASELKYCLNKVQVKALLCNETFKTQDYHSLIRSVIPELETSTPGGISSDQVPSLKHVIIITDSYKSGSHKYKDVQTGAGSESLKKVDLLSRIVKMDSPANIQFTSGTTGNPKGVTLSHHNIVNNAFQIGNRIGYGNKAHRICVSVPLYHCFGNVAGSMGGMLYGATNVYPAPSFNGLECAKAIESEKCTSIYGTPTMFVDILASARQIKPDVSRVETGIMAGAPCPKELCKNVVNELNMKDFVVCYGMTETSPVTFQGFCSDDMEKKTGTIGFPSNHVEVAVMDSDGKIVPVGQSGELCTRGYSTMLGYWEDKEKTEESITPDRWFHTGDIAVMDKNGY